MNNDFKLNYFIGEKSLYREMIRIAVPVSLQMLITVGINLIDTIMLSSMGDAQLSASSLASQFINVFQICCMGIGMGASVLTSRFWGAKDAVSLKQTITIMVRICLAFLSVFTFLTAFAPGCIMWLYTKDTEITAYGLIYLKWMIPTYLFMGFSLTCTAVIRSVGQVRIPLASSIAAFFVNVFFNWVLIYGKLGAPRMEIAGAALGTLIARAFEFAFIGGYFFFFDKRIGYRWKDILLDCSGLIREYVRISIPVIVSDLLLALGTNALSMVMGHIGSAFVAANSVTMVAQQTSSALYQGISNASAILTGHTMGQGNYEKARQNGFAFLFMGIVMGILGCGLILAVREPLINYYKVSEEAKDIAWQLMNAMSVIIIFMSISHILTKGVLRAGGDTRFLMAGDIIFLWTASIPLGALVGLVLQGPPFLIYCSLRIDQLLKCILCIWRLRSGKWMKKIEGTEKRK
ncbi:MAG: MATE family efflux transporter [Anaerovoracaceae bacterium]